MPREYEPFDDEYAAVCNFLSYKSLILQHGLQASSARDFVKCMGDEASVMMIDGSLKTIVETHQLFSVDAQTRIRIEECAKNHIKHLMRSLEYTNRTEDDDALPLPSEANAFNLVLSRFYDLSLKAYKLPKIESL